MARWYVKVTTGSCFEWVTTVNEAAKTWSIYLIRCGDGSLYTGITIDVPRRLAEHGDERGSASRGAKFLRGKGPLSVVFEHVVGNRSAALKLEYRIKQLSKPDKERLVNRQMDIEALFA